MSGLRLGKLIAKAKKGPVPLASTRHIHTRLLSGLHWIEYLVILLSPKGRETQRRLLIYSQDEQASSRQGWQCNRPQSGAMVACMAYRACRLRCGVKVMIYMKASNVSSCECKENQSVSVGHGLMVPKKTGHGTVKQPCTSRMQHEGSQGR